MALHDILLPLLAGPARSRPIYARWLRCSSPCRRMRAGSTTRACCRA